MGLTTDVTGDADRVGAMGRRAEVQPGRHPERRAEVECSRHQEPSTPGLHLPPGRDLPLPAPRAPLNWDVGSSLFDAATIAGLRASLHELAADVHELAAAIHDLKAAEHEQALRHAVGDPELHRLWADLRRTAAAREWADARKERHAAEQLRHAAAS